MPNYLSDAFAPGLGIIVSIYIKESFNYLAKVKLAKVGLFALLGVHRPKIGFNVPTLPENQSSCGRCIYRRVAINGMYQ